MRDNDSEDRLDLILTSNFKTRDLRIQATRGQIRSTFCFLGLGLVMIFPLAIDYIDLLRTPSQNAELRRQNRFYNSRLNEIRSSRNHLQGSLSRARQLSEKIGKITNLSERRSLFRLEDFNLSVSEYEHHFGELSEQPTLGYIPLERQPATADPPESFTQSPMIPLKKSRFEFGPELWAQIDAAIDESEILEQKVLGLWEALSVQEDLLKATPSIRPAEGWYSSSFGYRIDPVNGSPSMHTGLDIAAPPGREVIATAAGEVRYVGNHAGYGYVVVLDHGYGVQTRYAHNSRVFVTKGQKVGRRDRIAAVGSTGRSTGPHLHYEVRVNGIPVDPMNYILD